MYVGGGDYSIMLSDPGPLVKITWDVMLFFADLFNFKLQCPHLELRNENDIYLIVL